MYKKIVNILLASIILFFGYQIYLKQRFDKITPSRELQEKGIKDYFEEGSMEFEYEKYNVIVDKLDNFKKVPIPNFTEKLSSENIIDKYGCGILINGAMYSKSSEPLGLYFLDGKEFGKFNESSILNGVVSISKNTNLTIHPSKSFVPGFENYFYMQTGPVMIENGQDLSYPNNSVHARRIILASDSNAVFYVLVIFDGSNFSDGPVLTEVTAILKIFEERVNVDLLEAVNLDGGNASLYISGKHSIKESSLAGSFLCFQK